MRLVSLIGLPGVGKSAVAEHLVGVLGEAIPHVEHDSIDRVLRVQHPPVTIDSEAVVTYDGEAFLIDDAARGRVLRLAAYGLAAGSLLGSPLQRTRADPADIAYIHEVPTTESMAYLEAVADCQARMDVAIRWTAIHLEAPVDVRWSRNIERRAQQNLPRFVFDYFEEHSVSRAELYHHCGRSGVDRIWRVDTAGTFDEVTCVIDREILPHL